MEEMTEVSDCREDSKCLKLQITYGAAPAEGSKKDDTVNHSGITVEAPPPAGQSEKSGPLETEEGDEDQPSKGDVRFGSGKPKAWKTRITLWFGRVKTGILAILVVVCAILFAANPEDEHTSKFVDIEHFKVREWYNSSNQWSYVTVSLSGPFRDLSFHNKTPCAQFLFLCGPNTFDHETGNCPISETDRSINCQSVEIVDTEYQATVTRILKTPPSESFSIDFFTNHMDGVVFTVSIHGELISSGSQVAIAFIILVLVYILIGFELIHRALAAIIGSTFALGVLSMLNKRPTLEVVVSWIDLETVCLLVGMMILVGILAKTGVFDYAAVKAYHIARGREWPLIILLCGFTAVVSAFLDNVTTILLIVPVTIRLCQVLNLDPQPVLIAEVLFSNIGGAATAVGDPPNVIIVAHKSISEAGIGFAEFTLHMFLGILLAIPMGYLTLAIMYTCCFQYVKWRNKEAVYITELKREIRIWERAEKSVPNLSAEERVVKNALKVKMREVRKQLQDYKKQSKQDAANSLQKTVYELEQTYCITNKLLLAKSLSVVVVVIILFFLSSVIPGFHLGLGWIAIFGAVVLMILSGIKDMEEIMHKIEWSTLLFFAGLFVMMKALTQLGLLNFIGEKLVQVIKTVNPSDQTAVAIVIILWVSAIVSAFIDNIPFVTAMIPIIVELADSPDVCLNLKPLVWALAFGGCLGGNATLIGASANVVCAGIAEQNGYKITFKYFLKIGFPMMITTVFSVMVYLLIAHIAIGWNVTTCTLSASG